MRLFAALLATSLTFLAGCASYQLGSTAQLPYRAIAVAPPKNLSTFPRFEAPLAASLRQAMLNSGSLELADPARADAVLELTVLEIKRDIAAVTAEDVGRGRKFELTVDLELSLTRPGQGGRAFIDGRVFTVTQDIYADSGLVDAEYQATPELSRRIAERVAEMLVDRW